ncbi:MAG: hypothetical protein ABSB52_14840 [Acidimicrobiales bacterium]|jgi:hypothetical protein
MWRKVFDVVARVGSLAAVTAAGVLLIGTAAYATRNWVAASNGDPRSQATTASNLLISAVVSPVATNVLYPGGKGDVVVTISNLNAYPVTITAVRLPTDETYATGYTTSALETTKVGCLASTPSGVVWSYSTTIGTSVHILTKALTVVATGQSGNPLTVTFLNAASMAIEAPTACESTYFSMPALSGVIASRGSTTLLPSPTTDRWTS